jgi:hypothetical protein
MRIADIQKDMRKIKDQRSEVGRVIERYSNTRLKIRYLGYKSCFVLEIFRPKLMSVRHHGLILDLINYGFDDVRSWVKHIKQLLQMTE